MTYKDMFSKLQREETETIIYLKGDTHKEYWGWVTDVYDDFINFRLMSGPNAKITRMIPINNVLCIEFKEGV